MDEEGGIKPEVVNRKEVSKRLAGGRVIPRMLAVLGLIAMVGCGNVEKVVNPPPVTLALEMMEEMPASIEPAINTTELQTDIVSVQELAKKYHTNIWNLPDIKLHIRQKALQEEALFRDLKSREINKLDIVLVNGPYMNSSFLTPEQKAGLPDLVADMQQAEQLERSKREKWFQEKTPEMKKSYEEQSKNLQERLERNPGDKEMIDGAKSFLLASLRPFFEGPSEEDLTQNYVIGFYYPVLKFQEDLTTGESRVYILLAVRENKNKSFGTPTGPNPLKLNQSYPKIEEPNQTIGYTLRHEGKHRVADHPKTDEEALKGLKKAYDAYQNGDDSFYYFVFETPEGNIYTRNRTPVEQPVI